MKQLKLTVDITLPGMAGGKTCDLATIQRNILNIQHLLNRKIYKPADIRPAEVLVVTNIYQFICVINIKMREFTGYMSFINARKSEFAALDIFHLLCPSKDDDCPEMEERFLKTYRDLKESSQNYPLQPVYFIDNRAAAHVEMMY